MFYLSLALIYIALVIVFIADVLRNQRLSTGGKIGWIVLVILFPVIAWVTYGYIRMRQSRGLA
jgi:Phospholipase_D-nuclease N-terminal